MAKIGDTIKIRLDFFDWDDIPRDPDSIFLKVYDTDKNLITAIPIDSSHRLAEGIYELFYTIPDGSGSLITRVEGALGNLPIAGSSSITREW